MSGLNKAIKFATKKHAGQVDKSGVPYIFHPLAVGADLARQHQREAVVIAGILHDTLEDTRATPMELADYFGADVLCLVEVVTKVDGESYVEFIDRVIDSGREACRIKLADINDNTRPERQRGIDGITLDRLHRKYAPAKLRLQYAIASAPPRVPSTEEASFIDGFEEGR